MVADTNSYFSGSYITSDNSHRIIGAGPIHLYSFLMVPEIPVNSGASGKKFGLKLAVSILSIPALVLFFEVLLVFVPIDTFFENRFFILNRALDYPEVFKRDEHLFWRLRPSQEIESKFFENHKFKINSYGLRGSEIALSPEKVRIVGIGNSCTFGWRMPEDKIFLRRLETKINNDSSLPEVEVINAGVPGYSSYQGRLFYESDISKLKPDIIILMFGWNDQWAAADNIPDKGQNFPPQFVLDMQDIISRLKIYRLMRKLILAATEETLDKKLNKENPVYRVAFEDFYLNLRNLADQAKNDGASVIILTSPIPSLEQYYPPGSRSNMHIFHELYNRQSSNLAEDGNLGLIDLALEFDKYGNLFDNAKIDPIHFNARGHEIATALIYEFFKANPGLLSKR